MNYGLYVSVMADVPMPTQKLLRITNTLGFSCDAGKDVVLGTPKYEKIVTDPWTKVERSSSVAFETNRTSVNCTSSVSRPSIIDEKPVTRQAMRSLSSDVQTTSSENLEDMKVLAKIKTVDMNESPEPQKELDSEQYKGFSEEALEESEGLVDGENELTMVSLLITDTDLVKFGMLPTLHDSLTGNKLAPDAGTVKITPTGDARTGAFCADVTPRSINLAAVQGNLDLSRYLQYKVTLEKLPQHYQRPAGAPVSYIVYFKEEHDSLPVVEMCQGAECEQLEQSAVSELLDAGTFVLDFK
ncbi:MAG: hypothetical protein LBP35_04185 [Candidatus Ancillula trichonymphae]|jgi:hypothetical protein|nr:hypothetical protein [Candidatus Ancillula trichonymphae]